MAATLSGPSAIHADLVIGGYQAWFSAPDTVGLDSRYLLYQAPGGLNASMRPSHDVGITKAALAFAQAR